MKFLTTEQHTQSTESQTDPTLDLGDNSPATTPSSSLPSASAHPLRPPDSNLNIAEGSCDTSKWIESRRPSNPDLYCYNYNRAETAIREGLPGKEFGGAYLCLECLGVEYRDVDQDESRT